MKKETRVAIGAALFLAILVTLTAPAYAQDVWMRLTPPVQCGRVSITPSTIPEGGYSIIRVSGSGCYVPFQLPATVIVWTAFGNSRLGLQAPNGALLSGGATLTNGNFTVIMALYGAYTGLWDVDVQIWQGNQVVNEGSGGVLTVVKT